MDLNSPVLAQSPTFLDSRLSLRTLPVDVFRILAQTLDTEPLSKLYATFDRRIQKLLSLGRSTRSVVIPRLKFPQDWTILYYLTSIGDFDAFSLEPKAEIPERVLVLLSSLRPTTLTLSYHSIALDPKHSVNKRYVDDGKTTWSSDIQSNCFLDLSSIFPVLSSLYITCPFASIISSGSFVVRSRPEVEWILNFAKCLPSGLQTLHCPHPNISCNIQCEDLFKALPPSLTNVTLGGQTWQPAKLQSLLTPLPNLRYLCVNFSDKQLPNHWHSCAVPFGFPDGLEVFSFSIHSSDASSLQNPLYFPFLNSCLHTLIITGETAKLNLVEYQLDLNQLLPPTLTSLTLSDALLVSGITKDLAISSFPSRLLSLELGRVECSSLLIQKLAPLHSLHSFVVHPPRRPTDPIDWSPLPQSLTSLKVKEYTFRQGELFQLPRGLCHLQCHLHLLTNVRILIEQCPECHFVCDSEMYLSPFNMMTLLEYGLDLAENITTWNIIGAIRNFVGSRCTIQMAFCEMYPRNPLEALPLSPHNVSLLLEPITTGSRQITLNPASFDVNLVKMHRQLTRLEFQSKTEISSLKLFPPNLVFLNLRSSPLKNGISLKGMPRTLTSLTSNFVPTSFFTVDSLPTTNQICILDTPHLTYHPIDLRNGCSQDLEIIDAKISWLFDKDVAALLKLWENARRIQIHVVAKLTGHLLKPNTQTLSYQTLEDDAREEIRQIQGVTQLELLSPATLLVPSTTTSIQLQWTGNQPSTLSGFENKVLPSSVTHLEAFLGLGMKDVFAQLPTSLLSLHLLSVASSISSVIGPFPKQLKALTIECTQPKKLLNVPFKWEQLPASLLEFNLINCSIEYPKTGVLLKNLTRMELAYTDLTIEEQRSRYREAFPFVDIVWKRMDDPKHSSSTSETSTTKMVTSPGTRLAAVGAYI